MIPYVTFLRNLRTKDHDIESKVLPSAFFCEKKKGKYESGLSFTLLTPYIKSNEGFDHYRACNELETKDIPGIAILFWWQIFSLKLKMKRQRVSGYFGNWHFETQKQILEANDEGKLLADRLSFIATRNRLACVPIKKDQLKAKREIQEKFVEIRKIKGCGGD